MPCTNSVERCVAGASIEWLRESSSGFESLGGVDEQHKCHEVFNGVVHFEKTNSITFNKFLHFNEFGPQLNDLALNNRHPLISELVVSYIN